MDKKSFVMYQTWAEVIKLLPREEAGELIQAICSYVTGDDHEIENPVVNAIFEGQIKPKIEEDERKYNERVERINKVNESRDDIVTKSSRSRHDIVSVTVTDTVTDKDIKEKDKREKRTRFSPPTLEQVKEYCQERKNSVDPERFIDFYESKGWVVGKSPMKDWKAAVRNWEKESKPQSNKNKFKNFDERSYDMKSLEEELVSKSMGFG